MARERSQDEKLFTAAVLRRSMELGGDDRRQGFRFVYDGVLRDLDLTDDEVAAFLKTHGLEVDTAIGRGRP
jgi:hypothetical protein